MKINEISIGENLIIRRRYGVSLTCCSHTIDHNISAMTTVGGRVVSAMIHSLSLNE
jgi:hypothetical protein